MQMLRFNDFLKLKYINRYFNCDFKNRSRAVLRLWGDHCEYIIAQRIRRAQQMFYLYHNIWDEHAFRFMTHIFRKQVNRLDLLCFDCKSRKCLIDFT